MLIKAVDDEEMTFLMHAAAGCGCSRRRGQQDGAGASDGGPVGGDDDDGGGGGGGDDGDAAEVGEAGRSARATAESTAAVSEKDPGLVVFKTAWALVKTALWKEQASEKSPPCFPSRSASLQRRGGLGDRFAATVAEQ